ncbi:4Fe-4S single cluster domain-containing protein [Sporomusa malonica]|uniref:Anaerobic ribonucleoside-triphosphate reductase-activating protein n=1 Tax=Sporomusa malonica TaxID=112901 RepID=A0A1W2BEU4_9FIRM|nr:4Fe-4S single cluster domain-containing protein [Sporomusa malonica]SMC70878.1 anaerobic ribonucleoside-triphosphate reductase activating protein [Sporomusa malonica]
MNVQGKNRQGGLINMAAFLPKSVVNGPGLRAVVWVQGCPRRCQGCFNQDMLEFKDNQVVSAEELASSILAIQGINGVTFSGGEPFAQADSIAELAEYLAIQGLTITIFTGYTYQELKAAANPGWNRLLAVADLLVAGPYVKERPSNEYLLGSANQELIFLTDRLREHPDFTKNAGHAREFSIDAAGNIVISGLG